jgi:HK97 family phage prohead protease
MATVGRRKWTTAQVKQTPTDGSGRFTAIVSTFGPPPDSQGDVIAPGAFLLSIADWRVRGKRPTLWWQHDYSNPQATLGTIERMYESDDGLVIEAQLDLDHEPAVAVYEGLLARRLNEFSIGYAVLKEHRESSQRFGSYTVLDEVELLEVSVVSSGANRFTRVLDVKQRPRTDVSYWMARIAEAATGQPVITDEDRKATDDFILQEKLAAIQRALDRDAQARWEGDMAERSRWLVDTTPEIEREREAEFRSREQAELDHREAVREREYEEREATDKARRRHAQEDPTVFAW